jgi:hypothetical protein
MVSVSFSCVATSLGFREYTVQRNQETFTLVDVLQSLEFKNSAKSALTVVFHTTEREVHPASHALLKVRIPFDQMVVFNGPINVGLTFLRDELLRTLCAGGHQRSVVEAHSSAKQSTTRLLPRALVTSITSSILVFVIIELLLRLEPHGGLSVPRDDHI